MTNESRSWWVVAMCFVALLLFIALSGLQQYLSQQEDLAPVKGPPREMTPEERALAERLQDTPAWNDLGPPTKETPARAADRSKVLSCWGGAMIVKNGYLRWHVKRIELWDSAEKVQALKRAFVGIPLLTWKDAELLKCLQDSQQSTDSLDEWWMIDFKIGQADAAFPNHFLCSETGLLTVRWEGEPTSDQLTRASAAFAALIRSTGKKPTQEQPVWKRNHQEEKRSNGAKEGKQKFFSYDADFVIR